MPFDMNGGELLVILLLAALLLGPDRLPELARSAARLVRRGRDFATGASAQMKDEMGVDLDGVDWRRYDPRQYHPRRIVQNALSDAFNDEDDSPAARRKAGSAASKRAEATRTPASATVQAATNTSALSPPRSGSSAATSSPAARIGPGSASAQTVRSSTSSVPRRPSPAPSTWADAARRAGVDSDAT